MDISKTCLARQRKASKKLRVCFPNGEVLCYSSSKETFLQTLRRIDPMRFFEVDLELCHLPLLSQTVYPKYKDYMECVGEGWYVNVQSDTDAKYRQLSIINEQLQLDLIVDMSAEFKGERMSRGGKKKGGLRVSFPKGLVIQEEGNMETFIQCVREIGFDTLKRKDIQYAGKDFLTSTQKYKDQVQVGEHTWLTIPSSTKEKVKLLKVLSIVMKQPLWVHVDDGTPVPPPQSKRAKAVPSAQAKGGCDMIPNS